MTDFFCFIASLVKPNISARKTSNDLLVYLNMKSLREKLSVLTSLDELDLQRRKYYPAAGKKKKS